MKATPTSALGVKLVDRIVVKKRTSIGSSVRSKPLNKHKRRNWKRYRGQGT